MARRESNSWRALGRCTLERLCPRRRCVVTSGGLEISILSDIYLRYTCCIAIGACMLEPHATLACRSFSSTADLRQSAVSVSCALESQLPSGSCMFRKPCEVDRSASLNPHAEAQAGPGREFTVGGKEVQRLLRAI